MMASGRKGPSVIHQCSPDLSGQQKFQGIPTHTLRPSLTSVTPHDAGSKSRFSDVKYKQTSQPLCSRLFPHSRPRANKPEKELEEHKKPECKETDKVVKKERKTEIQKTNRKGEERKRRKKKEEKRLGERRKKRDKAVKKERKLGSKIKERGLLLSMLPSNSSGEVKKSKTETTTLTPENQSQSPSIRKHSLRSEQEEKMHRPLVNTPHSRCTLPQTSSKSENHKMPIPQSLVVKNQLMQSHPRNPGLSQTSKKPTVVTSQSEDGPKKKPDNSLPSLLFEALAPLSTACSVSLEQPIHGKEGVQGVVLNAPDLQPVTVMGNLREMGENLANTPPVLSWQGSPVSDVGEDEEDLEKGVICRPVLQPSPTQCFSPPPVDSERIDDINKEPCETILTEYSHNDTSELCDLPRTTEEVAEEEKKEEADIGRETSDSLLRELCHHKAGLDDVFKSLATFLGGQRVPCRGGLFGGCPPSVAKGVKCSSSLSFGPEHQDSSSKLDTTASSKSCNQSSTQTNSETLFKSHSLTYLSEPVIDALVQDKQEETENDIERKHEGKNTETPPQRIESSLLDESLSAELTLTTTNPASLTSLLTVSTKENREPSDETEHTYIHPDTKTKRNGKDGERKGEIRIKLKAEDSSVTCHKNNVNEISDLDGMGVSSSVSVISRSSTISLKDSTKDQISQDNQTPRGKDNQEENMCAWNTELKTAAEEKEDVCKLASANTDTKTSNLTVPHSSSKLCVSTPASKPPYSLAPADPLKLKALSMGLCKELKIILIKMENIGRQTYNISEVEEQRIPLSKISIENTANEVVRACK